MKSDRVVLIRAVVLGLLVFLCVLVYMPEIGGANFGQWIGVDLGMSGCEEGMLCVSYLDVGQGDATFIESPTGVQVLIDGGRDQSVMRELPKVMKFFDKDIDIMIPTHPDSDHITGLVDVLDRYNVATIIRTENESDTAVWKSLEEKMSSEGAKIIYARRGQVYDLGGGVVLEILFPDRDVSGMESNTSSIVARLTYGSTSFLFMGDSPKAIEEYLVLTEGEHLKTDVLKVGHHGSRTSTSELFLAEVAPKYAIISAGKNNQYGHPHVEVTDLLFNYGVQVLSTIEMGTIRLHSDGTTIEVVR